MKKLSPSLLLAAAIGLAASSAHAQGKIGYTWNGYGPDTGEAPRQPALFTASFDLPAGQTLHWPDNFDYFFSGQNLTITSPDHTWPGATGELTAYAQNFWIVDPNFGYLTITPTQLVEHGNTGIIWENGYWNPTVIPEPSCAMLLGLGLLALSRKKATGRK